MGGIDFSRIKDEKIRNIYTALWKGNSIIDDSWIHNTITHINQKQEDGTSKSIAVESQNSYSFYGQDNELKTLMNVFGIDSSVFENKYNMAISGAGNEARKILTLHSSSLCALLFFYNISKKNKLVINNIGTFTDVVFEFKNSVTSINNCSNIDVVLLGTNSNGEQLVFFLESKFAEYYKDASRKSEKISDAYLDKESFSSIFYDDDFLSELNIRKKRVDNHHFILEADEKIYLDGIKQMISHYVGIRNVLEGKYPFKKQRRKEQDKVSEAIRNGAKIVLAEILFDNMIGEFKCSGDKSFKDVYSDCYKELAKKMNCELKNSPTKECFEVFSDELVYSILVDDNIEYEINKKIKQFYFGEK